MTASIVGWRRRIAAILSAALATAGIALAQERFEALKDPRVNWSDLKSLATCRVDPSAERKRVLAILVGVETYVFEREVAIPNARNDVTALRDLLTRAYAGDDLEVRTFKDTTTGALRDAFESALTKPRCPDLVALHFSGAGYRDGDPEGVQGAGGQSLKKGLCPYYLLVGAKPSRIDASPNDLTELCVVALRNAATAFRNRGTAFLTTIEAGSAELADLGGLERDSAVWRREVGARIEGALNDALLHSAAAGFSAFYGAKGGERAGSRSDFVGAGVTAYGNMISPFIQALGADLNASARDIVDYFGLRAASGLSSSLVAEASYPDRPALYPWLDAAPAAPARAFKLEDFLEISSPVLSDGEAIIDGGKAEIRGRLKPAIRSRIKSVQVDGVRVAVGQDGSFAHGVALRQAVNNVRILLITRTDELIPLSIDIFWVEGGTFVPKGKQHALLIGNQKYTGEGWPPLTTPTDDVKAIGAILERRYGMTVERLEDASRAQMLAAINRLVDQATEEDSILIFYAGHGKLEETTGKAYWIPVDAGRRDTFNWVSSEDLRDALERADARARHILVFADSCFSGALFRSETRAFDASGDVPAGAERVAFFERMYNKRSRIAISSGAVEPVLDGGGAGHSIFARAFIKALTEGDEPTFTSADVYVDVRRTVSDAAAQTPIRNPFSLIDGGGDFIFVRK